MFYQSKNIFICITAEVKWTFKFNIKLWPKKYVNIHFYLLNSWKNFCNIKKSCVLEHMFLSFSRIKRDFRDPVKLFFEKFSFVQFPLIKSLKLRSQFVTRFFSCYTWKQWYKLLEISVFYWKQWIEVNNRIR